MEKPFERMKRKVEKENLWYYVLRLLKQKSRYGNEIRALIHNKFGFWPGIMTAYKILYDLEAGGYVKCESRSYRKKYSITSKGGAELDKTRGWLRSI